MNPHIYGHLIFDKGAKTIQWKKDSIFNKWCWHNWRLSCRRKRIDPFLSPCTKLKSKWIKVLHIKPDTLNLIEEKVGESLEYLGPGEKFLNRTPMAYALRSRIDIAVSCEVMPVPGKYRSGCSQSTIGWNTGPPMEELEKVTKELKGSATLYRWNNNMNYPVPPGASVSSCIRKWPVQPSVEREAHWSCRLYMPQYRGSQGQEVGWVGGGVGDFWDSIGNVNEINTQ